MSKDFTRDATLQMQKGVRAATRYGPSWAYMMSINTIDIRAFSFCLELGFIQLQFNIVKVR